MTSDPYFYTAKRFSRNWSVHVDAYVNNAFAGMLTERDKAGIKAAAEAKAQYILEEKGPRKEWTDYFAAALANQTSGEA